MAAMTLEPIMASIMAPKSSGSLRKINMSLEPQEILCCYVEGEEERNTALKLISWRYTSGCAETKEVSTRSKVERYGWVGHLDGTLLFIMQCSLLVQCAVSVQ